MNQALTTNLNLSKEKFFQMIGYRPHEGQVEFHQSPARFKTAVCGRRFGKSKMAGVEVAYHLLNNPKSRIWIVGPTYDLAEKEFREVHEIINNKLRFGEEQPPGYRTAYNLKTGDMRIEMPWGATVICRTADKPDKLVGESLTGVVMSEAAKHHHETWERFIRPALADRRGWAIFPTTPEGFNWIYDMFTRGQPTDQLNTDQQLNTLNTDQLTDQELNNQLTDQFANGGVNNQVANGSVNNQFASWQFPSWMNKVVYPGGRDDPEIKLIEDTATSQEWFDQEIAAIFTAFSGKIYGAFDNYLHIDPEMQFDVHKEGYLFFDYGFTNPFACLFAQLDPSTDTLNILWEYYERQKPTFEHGAQIKQLLTNQGWFSNVVGRFGDPAGADAAATLSQMLGYVHSESSDINTGIEEVRHLLVRSIPTEIDDPVWKGEQKPRLFVHPRCKNLIREFNTYKIKTAKRGNEQKEAPLKIDDHAVDALRYGVINLFGKGNRESLNTKTDRLAFTSDSTGIFKLGVDQW